MSSELAQIEARINALEARVDDLAKSLERGYTVPVPGDVGKEQVPLSEQVSENRDKFVSSLDPADTIL